MISFLTNTPFIFAQGRFQLGPCTLDQASQNPFFNFPVWWKYIEHGRLDGLGNCTPIVELPAGIWLIGLALVDMLLHVAGLVAVVMIIIAGVQYITAGGEPDKAAEARRRIWNALIGLGIVLVSIAFVTFVGQRLT